MQILGATDYGFRTVIRVLKNPDDPKWVHPVGECCLDDDGEPTLDVDGEPILFTSPDSPQNHTGDTIEATEPGKVLCRNCRSNWNIGEYLWDGAEQYKSVNGDRVRKTSDEFEQELLDRIAEEGQPISIILELEGRIL